MERPENSACLNAREVACHIHELRFLINPSDCHKSVDRSDSIHSMQTRMTCQHALSWRSVHVNSTDVSFLDCKDAWKAAVLDLAKGLATIKILTAQANGRPPRPRYNPLPRAIQPFLPNAIDHNCKIKASVECPARCQGLHGQAWLRAGVPRSCVQAPRHIWKCQLIIISTMLHLKQ